MKKTDTQMPEELQKAAKEHLEFLWSTIQLLEYSRLPEERRLFFQAALLEGYDSQNLLDQLFSELKASNKKWAEELEKLQQEVISDAQELQEQLSEYGKAAKLLRDAQQARRDATVSYAENRIQQLITDEDQSQIEALRAKISNTQNQ